MNTNLITNPNNEHKFDQQPRTSRLRCCWGFFWYYTSYLLVPERATPVSETRPPAPTISKAYALTLINWEFSVCNATFVRNRSRSPGPVYFA